MRPIGLLYDSHTPNFGDRAIGISLSNALADARIVFEFVRDASNIEGRFSALVVGGGHCFRAPGDWFYDRFRVPGRHILNAAGISEGAGSLSFLKDYRYVSVRSSGDYQRISDVRPDASIVPCSSLSIQGASDFTPQIEDGTILIHMAPSCSGFVPRWPESVDRAFPGHKKVLLTINRYNNDQEYLFDIAFYKGWRMISGLSPDQMDTLIAHQNVHGLLTTSLHGTMFAVKHSKPFLALPNIEKIRFFLQDRDLSSRFWAHEVSVGEMQGRLNPMSKDDSLGAIWKKDEAALKSHIARIVSECRAAIAEDGGGP